MIIDGVRIHIPEEDRISLSGYPYTNETGSIFISKNTAQHSSVPYGGYDYWLEAAWNQLVRYGTDHPDLIIETIHNDRVTHHGVFRDILPHVRKRTFKDGVVQYGIPEALIKL